MTWSGLTDRIAIQVNYYKTEARKIMGSMASLLQNNRRRQNQQTQDEPDTDTAIKMLEQQEENVSKSSINRYCDNVQHFNMIVRVIR